MQSALRLLWLLSVILRESGTRKALLCQLQNSIKVYLTALLVLKITQLQDKCMYCRARSLLLMLNTII
jgi:hypothetical protein